MSEKEPGPQLSLCLYSYFEQYPYHVLLLNPRTLLYQKIFEIYGVFSSLNQFRIKKYKPVAFEFANQVFLRNFILSHIMFTTQKSLI